jgi:hypothetical protein
VEVGTNLEGRRIWGDRLPDLVAWAPGGSGQRRASAVSVRRPDDSRREANRNHRQLLLAVLLGDLVGAAVLAPAFIGELTVSDTPVAFVAICVAGVQPLSAIAGAWIGQRPIDGRLTT